MRILGITQQHTGIFNSLSTLKPCIIQQIRPLPVCWKCQFVYILHQSQFKKDVGFFYSVKKKMIPRDAQILQTN